MKLSLVHGRLNLHVMMWKRGVCVWERESRCVEVLEVGAAQYVLGFLPQLCKDLSYANNLSVVKCSLPQICDSVLSW